MPTSPYVSRVNQIDAAQLDEEIYKVLRNQVREITKYQPPGKFDRWQPEIDALVKFLMWNFTLRHGKTTFGQELLNLHYVNLTRTKSVLYLILTILPSYARDKLGNYGDQRTALIVFDYITNLVKFLEFVNSIVFLHRGTQPRLIEYILGITNRSITTHRPRSIGYSYMTRELLWHGLMELFTTGLPMINFHYLKQTVKKLMRRSKGPGIRKSFPIMDLSTKCGYCNDSPILPTQAGCEHVFCYYCLKAHFTAMNEFQCPECGTGLFAENMKCYDAIAA